MPSSWLPLAVLLSAILLAEGVLWLLFRRKAVSLYVPELHQSSHFPPPLSITHIKSIAIAHTIFLLLCTITVTLLLW